MKRIFALSLMVWAGFANAITPYDIIKDEKTKRIKRSVDVVLNERVTERELREIAEDIYLDGFKRTFILYSIASEDQKTGTSWASTHFNPKLEVKILGSTIEEHAALKSLKSKKDGDVFGSWLANIGIEYRVSFYKENGVSMVRMAFSDGSSLEDPLKNSVVNGEKRYYTDSSKQKDEYYVIDKNGGLQFWNRDGNWYTAPKEK